MPVDAPFLVGDEDQVVVLAGAVAVKCSFDDGLLIVERFPDEAVGEAFPVVSDGLLPDPVPAGAWCGRPFAVHALEGPVVGAFPIA